MAVKLSALHAGRPLPTWRFLVFISVGGWVNPRATVRLKGLWQVKKKNSMTSSGIEPSVLPAWNIVPQTLRYRYRNKFLMLYNNIEVKTVFCTHNSLCSSDGLSANSTRCLPVPVPKATSIPWKTNRWLPKLFYWFMQEPAPNQEQRNPGGWRCTEVGGMVVRWQQVNCPGI
jgi:hypothetical protein